MQVGGPLAEFARALDVGADWTPRPVWQARHWKGLETESGGNGGVWNSPLGQRLHLFIESSEGVHRIFPRAFRARHKCGQHADRDGLAARAVIFQCASQGGCVRKFSRCQETADLQLGIDANFKPAK